MVSERTVTFDSNGRRLIGHVFEADGWADEASRPGVLFIHGYGSDQRGYRPRAEAAARATGGVCLTFDLSGHGESRSSGTLASLSALDHRLDAMAAYDVLASVQGMDLDRIGVCGASYGAYLAALLVSERRVSRLLLRAPAPSQDGQGEAPVTLSAYTGPVLVVESGRDEVVAKTTIAAYLEACGNRARYEVIESATHALTDPRSQQAFIDLIVDWFMEV